MKSFWLKLSAWFLLFIFIAPLAIFAQEKEKIPAANVTHTAYKAPQRFDKVDRGNNKIADGLDELIKPSLLEQRFDVIILLNQSLDVVPNFKMKYGQFSEKFTYPSINGFSATLTKKQILALSEDASVRLIEYDAPVYPFLDTAQQWFGTSKARTDFGVEGDSGNGLKSYSKDDVVVAVIDTGIDPGHVDLDSGKIIGWKDLVNNQSSPYDESSSPCNGHGTHVSSIVAGEGDGNILYQGVAPGAALVGVKVLGTSGSECSGATSTIIAGVQWIIDNKATYGIELANMSLGSSGCSDGTDSLSTIVNTAVDNGIAMVVAAGNEGPGLCSIGSPAAAEKAITVGAMADVTPGSSSEVLSCGAAPYRGFYLACFSSRGPTFDLRDKPDIVAPGVFVNAAQAGTTSNYIEKSGTSMSTPFVSGTAALMIDANSSLTPSQIKSIIESTASDWDFAGKDWDYGSGRLQGHEAIENAAGGSGSSVSVPTHSYLTGSLSGTGDSNVHTIEVTDSSMPLAATLIIVTGGSDFDLEVLDSAENPLFSCSGSPFSTLPCPCTNDPDGFCKSRTVEDQETIGFQPSTADVYKLRVVSFSGSGNYFIDVSFGQPVVSITLNTDRLHDFGTIPLNTASDNISDAEQVLVTSGPADLSVRSNIFSDGANTWALGTSNGANQVLWEFSKDAATWPDFSSADSLFTFDTNVAQGETRDLYLRLTMPTETSSNNQHSTTVTIVATSP